MRVENNNVSGQNHDPEQIDLIDLLVQLWQLSSLSLSLLPWL